MYVRYLQHQHHGTVQLLLMPLNTAASSMKSSKHAGRMEEDESGGECEPVPLPIQTFLWRQTNPFLGAKIGKLHEASCVTFERVVVQNILHGLSPSLSDAIESVSRWRFVRAAFPHIVQCCGALMSVRSNEDENLAMSGSLVKILYILHWLLIDAAAECSEMSINGIDDPANASVRHLTYSVPCIQMFVYMIAPLSHVIREEEIENHIRLESGLRLWQALWQFRQPEILCFSAPVKQRKNPLPQLNISRRGPVATATDQGGIYLGDDAPTSNASGARRPSQSPQTKFPSSVETPVKVLNNTNGAPKLELNKVEITSKPRQFEAVIPPPPTVQPASGIVRSVSDYKTSEMAGEVQSRMSLRKSRTDVFHQSPDDLYKGMRDIDEAMHFADENGSYSESFYFNDRAPLVQLQEICSAASIDTNSDSLQQQQQMLKEQEKSFIAKIEPTTSARSFGSPAHRKLSQLEDSLSTTSSQQTIINRSSVRQPSQRQNGKTTSGKDESKQSKKDSASLVQSLEEERIEAAIAATDPQDATYLDVATMRCLLIRNWSEDGVFWAVKYLLNRLIDIRQHRCLTDGGLFGRSRSNSVPRLQGAGAARGSKHEILNAEHLTWSDLQEKRVDRRGFNANGQFLEVGEEMGRKNVEFNVDKSKGGNEGTKLKVIADQRRISINTLPAAKRMSRTGGIIKKAQRSKSEPPLFPINDIVSLAATSTSSFQPSIQLDTESLRHHHVNLSRQKEPQNAQFFPEAIGSSMFIERNGRLNLHVVLRTLNALVERCAAIRILELVLNACDTLITIPAIDILSFFDGIASVCVKAYAHLGCANGCNEGMRTPQADFMRIKLRNILSQMHRICPTTLSDILRSKVSDCSSQFLMDFLHAMTVFCDLDAVVSPPAVPPPRTKSIRTTSGLMAATSIARRRSSTIQVAADQRTPSYRNNFNEQQAGMEGIILNTMLNPLVSKLMSKANDLYLPENMSLYQDVRMLVAYVQEYHGNPLRRTALSALACRLGSGLDIAGDSRSNSETASRVGAGDGSLSSCQRDNASLRRGLFKKKGDKFSTTVAAGAEESEVESSPSTPRNISSVDESLSNIGSPLLPHGSYMKKKSAGKLHFAFNLLKGRGADVDESEWDENVPAPLDDADETTMSAPVESRSRISFRNAAQKVNHFRKRQSLSIDNGYTGEGQEKPPTTANVNAEIPFIQLYLPSKRLINILDAREGARRFSFLLETCKPGQLPDAPLIAALLELKAPVLSRALIFVECAHFVHRCNHGNWPEWIRTGSATAGTSVRSAHSTSFSSAPSRPIVGGSRKTFKLQRAAGRCFYDWAIQISARLQKMCDRQTGIGDPSQPQQPPKETVGTEAKRRLKMLDDIEDFMDDGSVNDASGEYCPPALQLIACQLLYQITAFLRETFQLIPRSKIQHKNTGSTTGWEKLMSHRRWSILSNTFNQQPPQQHSGSIHSINDLHPQFAPERRVSYSTADEESSPRGSSHDIIDEQPLIGGGSSADKKEKDGSSALLALHRFASRGRLFSRETSLSTTTTDDGPEAPAPTVKILRSQHTINSNGGITPSSIAATVVGTMINVPDSGMFNFRRLAQGRQRLLKRGSPSSGDPQSSLESSRRRRETSFKIRKQSKSPTATDNEDQFSESVSGGGFQSPTLGGDAASFRERRRKTASLRASQGVRWHMRRSVRLRDSPVAASSRLAGSSVTARSSGNLDRQVGEESFGRSSSSSNQSPIVMYQQVQQRQGQVPLTGKARDSLKPTVSAKTSTNQDEWESPERRQQPLPHTVEDDEEEMIKNMPWIKTLISMLKQFDVNCPHDKHCTEWCFDRVYRQCNRLKDAFKLVYEDVEPGKHKHKRLVDRRKQLADGWQHIVATQELAGRKRSSNPRRESAVVRQAGIERVPLALRGLLIEKLSEIEDSKSSASKREAVEDTAPVDLSELNQKRPAIVSYLRANLFNVVHAPLSAMLKSVVIMSGDEYRSVINVSWSLLIHADVNMVATAAAMFICCAVKCADECIQTMKRDLTSTNPSVRSSAVRRFYALWRNRFHVWLKMEDGAQMIFKVPPPGIDFTLPSPPIGQSQQSVVDPPWMPHVKTKVEELSLKEEEHSTSQTIMTMTRTRRKQKQEMVKKAVREAEERQYELRQQFPLRATAVVQQAAYEPALFHHQTINLAAVQQQQQQSEGFADEYDLMHSTVATRQQLPVAQPLFPSSILSVTPMLIEMFDDVLVDRDGCSVGDVCKRCAWNCIIEDSALFLRHFLEKLTHQDKQEQLFALLRKLILTFRPLPSQTAYSLLNYLFGFVMFYVRTPCEGSDKSIAMSLSVLWLVVPYVHGLYFKDLKQTLKKEQCDQALMITANVPSAKKIIVHGPDSSSGGIPSQFPIHEDTQFQQILTDSLEFFNIPDEELDHYFLVDSKTNLIHNPASYVRDFYFFHRSFYPQLSLVKMDPETAMTKMKTCAFQQKLIEIGKVLLTHNALKHSPESVIPQRIFFLHDEFTHLPSFPRRSIESCFGMYQSVMGNELQAVDSMHKFVWSKLVSDMFEKMENAFMFGDLHLFINVINGIVIIHCEDVLIIRRCLACYLTMSIHFSTLFASNGFFLIMPTLLRCYSQRQTNRLFAELIEFTCKQFYILHRKPFLLQMFGSVADICDQNNNDLEINAVQVKAKYLFQLLLAMEELNEVADPLDILALALDLCYRDDPNTFMILTDAVASCVTVCAFAPESKRSHQMLLIMQSILPHFINHLEQESTRQNNSSAALKHEITCYSTMCVEMKALINCCETLSRGPTRTFDIVSSVADRGKSFIAESPQFFDPPTVVDDELKPSMPKEKKPQTPAWDSSADNVEMYKEAFRGPRDAYLILCALFIEKAGARLKELTKFASNLEHTKIPEIFDHKCYVKISEVALSLLKVAPYDLNTMGCVGLQKYFTCILPIVDWSVETNRSALSIILRRLDKTISKIGKKPSIRKRANWAALGTWLNGLYQTLVTYPYIAHLHPLKTITQMCLRLTVGDICTDEVISGINYATGNPPTILSAATPPQMFCSVVLKLTAFLMQALGQMVFSLEFVCSQEGLGASSERLEAVLCHILIPLFLMAAVPGKEAPQFQAKDLTFCLNLMYNAVCPPLAKQSLAPAASGTLATSLIRGTTHDNTGRQGSVSVTDRGNSATVSTHRIIRDSVVQAMFLAMKAMLLAFQKQMTNHWVRFGKISRELISKRLGGHALFSFVDFLLSVNLPVSLIVLPIVQQKLNQKPGSEQEAHWFGELRERFAKATQPTNLDIKGYSLLLNKLQVELQQMRDDFSSRAMELPRSHTPTIGADMHSDSGSTQSVSTHRSGRPGTTGPESRRLSSSTAFGKLRSTAKAAAAVTSASNTTASIEIATGHNLHDSIINEDIEDETTQMITGMQSSGSNLPPPPIPRVGKSPSLPSAARIITQPRTRSSFGLFSSIRRKSRQHEDVEAARTDMREPTDEEEPVELRELHRRTKSWNKRMAARGSTQSEDPVLITPLTMATESHRQVIEPSTPTSKTSEYQQSLGTTTSGGERPRMVSFSTPKHHSRRSSPEESDADSDEYCITARHHLI